ncbi:MAG: S9 family peptidase [Bacteroidales bacterium]|nr:S9 family peptidase [Bacteroidales bacterium]
MKKAFLLPCLLISLALQAQKKPLDHSVFDSWQSVANPLISSSGQVVSYEVNPQEGDGTLYIRVLGKKQDRHIEIPRGYKAAVLADESYAVCQIKPFFQKTRQAKIDKKKADEMPKDSLAIINLKTGHIRKFPDVKGFKVAKKGDQAFAFATADTCNVYFFADGHIDTLRNVTDYEFSKDGKKLALVRKFGKRKMSAGFYSTGLRKASYLPDTVAWMGLPVFDEEGTRALFLTAADTLESGSKHAVLNLWDGESARILETSLAALPEGWGMTENSKPSFSHNGSRIFVGVQAYEPPKDTTLVPFETPGLDIWKWDADEIPPYQKANLKREAIRTYTTELVDGVLRPFSLDKHATVMLGDLGDAPATLVTRHVNPVETQWNIQDTQEIAVIVNGERKVVAEGAFDSIGLSPLGKYVTWWDYPARKWMIYDIAAGESRPLIDNGVIFWQEDDDHPAFPDPYGMASQWVADDSAVLVYDRYDIWKVPTNGGAPVRLTFGRANKLTYRVVFLWERGETEFRHVDMKDDLLLSIFDHTTKKNGVASLTLDKAGKSFKVLAMGGYTWDGFKKARQAGAYLYQKGNFQKPMDLYVSLGLGKESKKLSAINPQISEYNWGTVELYQWTAFDGTQLDGLLYKPEDFDANKKYPVMCYFYERDSETLYEHIQVQPMWSIINIPFFVSRGYVVFVPDIVYHSGIPGECAYNCVVSGAQSLWQFPWIDRENMAIQGQSWGGYQVAYLITRTSMFKAAGAGAPVSNMTSAYGGIRWDSGMSRQFQYEQTQSRIGRDLWNGIELYMENSPLFKLPNVTTPVLIMHNDNDGAVPWYQGIEMFMGLRRLGKPAWLLEYNDEAHNLRQRRNRKDLSIRLQQFFDHYLKGEPMPAWMSQGVPTAKKGYYFGYEIPGDV